MEQLRFLGDDRIGTRCTYCGLDFDSRDHIPSRVLLDEPYPSNLPVVPACSECNSGFSLDEEYVACLVECARVGAVESVERPKIRRILATKPALAAALHSAKAVHGQEVSFSIESDRLKNVILKLARGHALYELAESAYGMRPTIAAVPIGTISPAILEAFESPVVMDVVPEIGSRAMQRIQVASVRLAPLGKGGPERVANLFVQPGWIDVQPERYRYMAAVGSCGQIIVRIVLSEYLACEVLWTT